jgi:hypothetical protein
MNNGTIEASFNQMKQAPRVQAVNMDEINRETIHVKLHIYKDIPLYLDDGTPFCDEQGNQLMGREVVGTRTAKIKNIVPTDAYHEAIEISSGFVKGQRPNADQLDQMTDMVLKCWQISEPFMTKKALREGVNGDRIMALFTRFFTQENPPSNTSPSHGSSTTPNEQG